MRDEIPDVKPDKTGKKAVAAQRAERLRKALRENMHRRKAQVRARRDTDKGMDDG